MINSFKVDKRIVAISGSIFTLVVALVLSLISLTLSWFAMNDKVGANDMQIQIESPENLTITGKRYKAILNDNNTYSRGEEISQTNKPEGYNLLGAYDRVIYEFEGAEETDISNISLTVNTAGNADNSIIVRDEVSYNYLSNVAVFNVLTKTNTSYTYSETTYAFGYYSSAERVNSINFGTIGSGNSIALLFNYSEENINLLLNANVGFDGDLFFIEDIVFVFS